MSRAKRERAPLASWESTNPSTRAAERFYLQYSVLWIGFVAVIVATRIFEKFDSTAYMAVGILIAGPCILYPYIRPFPEDKHLHWASRFHTKSTIWIWIISFIGNYFWTHYFYQVLGARYTFPAWRLNNVPFTLFLITHAYFTTYHTVSTIILRTFAKWLVQKRGRGLRVSDLAIYAALVLIMSYFVAFMETFTIQHFPYYDFPDRHAMYVVGSGFYAIYFIVSFPMYCLMSERSSDMTLFHVIVESLGSCMLVTLLLDFWRLGIGPIYATEVAGAASGHGASASVPFVY